jgi:hypothetical protein
MDERATLVQYIVEHSIRQVLYNFEFEEPTAHDNIEDAQAEARSLAKQVDKPLKLFKVTIEEIPVGG